MTTTLKYREDHLLIQGREKILLKISGLRANRWRLALGRQEFYFKPEYRSEQTLVDVSGRIG